MRALLAAVPLEPWLNVKGIVDGHALQKEGSKGNLGELCSQPPLAVPSIDNDCPKPRPVKQ